jgi:hypothetical protein
MQKRRVISLMFVAGLLAFTTVAWGQEKEAGQKPTDDGKVRKVIQLKYVNPSAVQRLFSPQEPNPFSPWGVIKVDDAMKVLTVAGSAAQVNDVEEAVKKLDVPPVPGKDVEITAYFLVASRQSNIPNDFPPALNEVVSELKKVLTYQSFSLSNTAIMRTLDGHNGTISGAVDTGMTPDQFRLDYHHLTVITQEKQTIVHLDDLNFGIWSQKHWEKGSPTNPDHAVDTSNLAGISTSVDIPVGQKVVVGKTAFGSAFENSDNALILVLTAKVMD